MKVEELEKLLNLLKTYKSFIEDTRNITEGSLLIKLEYTVGTKRTPDILKKQINLNSPKLIDHITKSIKKDYDGIVKILKDSNIEV